LRRHPVQSFVRARRQREWTSRLPQPVEPRAHLAKTLAVEAAAGVADVAQATGTIEVAEEDRAEMGSRSPRLGKAADDELGSVLKFELEPVVRSRTGDIARGAPFRDHALPSRAPRALQQARAVRRRLAEAHAIAGPAQHP